MKLFGLPLYIRLPQEIEASYVEASRKRFVPFVRIGLLGIITMEVVGGIIDYYNQQLYFTELRLVSLGVYFFLLGVTFIPYAVRYIHLIGAMAMISVIFFFSLMASYSGEQFSRYFPLFFMPLQLVPVMTSLTTALATLWVSVTIIFNFAQKADMTSSALTNVRDVLAYYVIVTAIIAYIATQYRRAGFQIEKKLEQARQDAEVANASKSTFLATMSHEVRTPLNGILGLITLMKDTPLNEQQRDYIETMKYSGETLLTILNDILDISKMEAGKFDIEVVDFDLERLVSSVVMLMKSRAEEKGLNFDYKIESNVPPHIRSDPTRIRQVLLNLTGNAIKFTQNGFVHVHVSNAAAGGEGPKLSFEVSDTGIGLSEEAQKNLFQEFVQADSSISRKYGGTGLGLSICKKIVELMKGRIGAMSTMGRGSTFWFEIPVEIGDTVSTQAEGLDAYGADVVPVFKPLHALVAEDNKINQKVISGLLGRCDIQASFANNGQEALDMLQGAKKPYDFVLMDMQMPVMDGLSAAGCIRALSGDVSKVPIIALTANAVKGDEQRCLAAGMNGYVPKPIDARQLYASIATHVPHSIIPGETRKIGAAKTHHRRQAEFEHLERLESMMGREYVQKFTEDGLQEIRDLINAICNSSNSKDIKRAAHNLKSLSSMFGLSDVQTLAESIELSESDNSEGERAVLSRLLQEKYESDLSVLTRNYLHAV